MPSFFCEPHFGAFLDEAEKFRREGNEVHILVCNGSFDICVANSSKDSVVCSLCTKYTNKFIGKISKDFCIHNIKNYFDNSIKYNNFNYNSVIDIKKIEYKGAKIGFASLSTYISKTRDLRPLFKSAFKHYFDYLLLQSCVLTDAIGNALNDIKPDLVCLFNGRFFDSRPIFDVAAQKDISVRCYDVVEYADKIFVKQISQNATLHSIKEIMSQLNHCWNSSINSLEDKIKIAHDFFQKKRDGIFIGEVVYIKNQEKGLLPVGFDKNKQNIVIFNSSEDEYAAIGDEYEKLSLFKSQIDGLEYIFRTFENNKKIHFYLRIHPNLSDIKYKYHTDLCSFQKKYRNVTVIPAEDNVSTYDLLDAAEKVIVFGSTIGVEAAYWNKAVILLSGAPYYYLDICYKPKSLLELKEMIVSSLEPREKKDALRFAYFTMHKDPDRFYKYVDFTISPFYFLGRKVYAINYKKIFGSPKLFAIHQGMKQKFLKAIFKVNFINHFSKRRIKF
ncbi:MAG: capsule biosynthesis protein [Candidatus Moranbacteria bacterium]|nr:capsule biosynthesis protein [Candidatus Moranbacteria bacterium]